MHAMRSINTYQECKELLLIIIPIVTSTFRCIGQLEQIHSGLEGTIIVLISK